MFDFENPFSVTKATEFTDDEIYSYWVNFNPVDDVSVATFLNTNEYLPKYIIGGKGCGKTHILRYFSFPIQKIRYKSNLRSLLEGDKYIGIYSIIHGINSSRFAGKSIPDGEWQSIFEYYFDLYICDGLLNVITDIFADLNINSSLEKNVVDDIMSIFSKVEEVETVNTIEDVICFFNALRKKIDFEILNAAFTRSLNHENVKVLFSPGDLIFGIPAILKKRITEFENIKFIYIFDEYEKLFEWQKQFVNTLVWDKKMPVTFWIGARKHGYTTRETKSGQEMKSGSEFQKIDLDELIRSNEALYKKFATELYTNRLTKFFDAQNLNVDIKSFGNRFDIYDETKIINDIKEKNKGKEFIHIKELRNKIQRAGKAKLVPVLSIDEINEIIIKIYENTDSEPLDLKYKVFLFYQQWYQNRKNKDVTFSYILDFVNDQYSKYKDGIKSAFDDVKDKRKKDFLAQLTKEYNIKNTEYAGLDKFIELSRGNARSFILILKKVIEFARIKGEKPLENGGRISLDSQYLAVFDTSKWFYEDAEVVGEEGKHIYGSLKRLTDILIQERFCDKPVDTTVSCFYVKAEELSYETINTIETMLVHSFIIEDYSGRKEKNSGIKERQFQLNKILAPLWNLPTTERGVIYLRKEIAEAIFDEKESNEFEKLYKQRKNELNAPDFLKMTIVTPNSSNKTLFD